MPTICNRYFLRSRPSNPGEGPGPGSRVVSLWGATPGGAIRMLVEGYETGVADVSGELLEHARRRTKVLDLHAERVEDPGPGHRRMPDQPEETYDTQITVHLTRAQKELLEAAAQAEGDPLSEWARGVLLEAIGAG